MTSGQLGVGIAHPDGTTSFHPCTSDREAWNLCHRLKDEHPDANVWVGIQQPGQQEHP